MAERTPKSPHPGHQSGSTLPFRSARVSCVRCCAVVAICATSLNHDLVHWNREFCFPGELFFHCFYNVVRHERLSIVLANVTPGHKTGFAAEVPSKLAGVIVLDDDGVPRILQNFENHITMEWHQPANLELIGGNPLVIENFAGFFDHSLRRTPPN